MGGSGIHAPLSTPRDGPAGPAMEGEERDADQDRRALYSVGVEGLSPGAGVKPRLEKSLINTLLNPPVLWEQTGAPKAKIGGIPDSDEGRNQSTPDL